MKILVMEDGYGNEEQFYKSNEGRKNKEGSASDARRI